jgi:hypothetical protein
VQMQILVALEQILPTNSCGTHSSSSDRSWELNNALVHRKSGRASKSDRPNWGVLGGLKVPNLPARSVIARFIWLDEGGLAIRKILLTNAYLAGPRQDSKWVENIGFGDLSSKTDCRKSLYRRGFLNSLDRYGTFTGLAVAFRSPPVRTFRALTAREPSARSVVGRQGNP